MSPGKSPRPADASDEIAALIETLHQTGQRLEELTGGEVDTVADRDGRTFLLRHAQDHLRHSEAAKQAAILNALPAHIALLDTQGRIISVNEAWRRFAGGNALLSPECGIGVNYLEICDSAQGDDASEAYPAAAGIRSVLAGAVRSFSLEYPCHSPEEQRWFLMTVTPLADDRLRGAVVMHLNITERMLAEVKMRALSRAMEQSPSSVIITDRAGKIEYVNPRFEQVTGYTSAEVAGENPSILKSGKNAPEVYKQLWAAISVGGEWRGELCNRRKNGELFWEFAAISGIRTENGQIERYIAVKEDITGRKQAECRIGRLNRVYAVLSGINALIVRVRDRDELFQGACRIAVDHGQFKMAWIGIVDRSEMKVIPVASAGAEQDLMAFVKAHFSLKEDAPLGNTLTARAIRGKKTVVANDLEHDPTVMSGKRHVERGVRSMAILPLLISDEAVGVLALCADEAGFFDDDELKLLTELAGDIAFAIDHIEKQERLDYLAYFDALTGLANRTLFLERLAQYVRNAVSNGHKLALFLIDLERFKNINDSLGRAAGDALLRQVAEWLTRNAGDANLLARVGADHFAVVMPVVKREGEVARINENSMDAFRQHPFRLNDAVFRIAHKAGIALYPDDGADAETLLRNAEAALRKAKASGQRCLFYTQSMTEAVAGKLSLENQLRQAIDNEEFELHYQPKVNLVNGKVTSAEARIRWNDPRTGLVPPGKFIPILEETGLIYDVGRWALRRAIADYLRWRAAGLAAVRIAVNVSPLQLRHRGFVDEIRQVTGIDTHAPAGLELEITESVIMEDVKGTIASLQAIRDLGVSITIDGFGTGFSSLSYLAKLPVDALKIDRSFVIDMTAGPEGLALVSTIIDLAHSLNLKVVADGVETEEQARLLRLLACDEMQGFLFSKPVPAEIFETRFLVPPAIG